MIYLFRFLETALVRAVFAESLLEAQARVGQEHYTCIGSLELQDLDITFIQDTVEVKLGMERREVA